MAVIDNSSPVWGPRFDSVVTGKTYTTRAAAEADERAYSAAREQGRPLPTFNPEQYRAANKDLQNMSLDQATEHYQTHGFKENRNLGLVTLPEDWDYAKYLQANPSVRAQGISTPDAAARHYQTQGAAQRLPTAPATPAASTTPTTPAASTTPTTPAAPSGPSPALIQAREQMAANLRAREQLLARKRAEMAAVRPQTYKKGGAVKSRRGDGIAKRGFTKGRMV